MCFTKEMIEKGSLVQSKLLAKMEKLFSLGMEVSQSVMQHVG